MKKDGTAGACGIYGGEEKWVQGLVGNTWTEMCVCVCVCGTRQAVHV